MEDQKKTQNQNEQVIIPVDACCRPLQIPKRFIPYLEKYRIYELMHQLATDLVIKLPKDHIQCIKNNLEQIQMGRDNPRIILIAPPYIDKLRLAELMAFQLNISLFSLNDITAAHTSNDFSKNEMPTEILAETAVKILQSHFNKGWIFHDIPRNRTEAYALQRAGFLPTHTLHLFSPSLYESVIDYKKMYPDLTEKECYERMKMIRRHILGIRYVFQSTIQEILLDGRNIEDLALDAVHLCQKFRHLGPPLLPRIVVIGMRGSGRRTLSKALANHFHLILINFESTIEQALEEDTIFGERLREISRNGLENHPEMMISIIEQRITQWDCLENGWILFGYPRTIDEMKLMDLIDTPPNRVLLLITPIDICIERITSRCYNKYTGEKYQKSQVLTDKEYSFEFNLMDNKLPECSNGEENFSPGASKTPPRIVSEKHVTIRPNDAPDLVYQQVSNEYTQVEGIRSYCGRSATILDGSQSCRPLFERASAAVIQMAPGVPPRDPIGDAFEETTEIQDNTMKAIEMLLAKKQPNNRYQWTRSVPLSDEEDRNHPDTAALHDRKEIIK